jgi:hypothetical protein
VDGLTGVWDALLDGFAGTWLGDVLPAIAGLWPLLVVAGVATVVGVAGYALVLFVSKGAGQVGIIEGYVGTIGAGKTTLGVQHALGLARARRAVLLSNIPIVCGRTCKGGTDVRVKRHRWSRWRTVHLEQSHDVDHELLPMTDEGIDLGELTRRAFALRDEGRGLVLFMDEVGVVMPARLWKDFSVALMWVLQQSRKLACEWIWTAQDPAFVDHQLRSLTSAVHFVRSTPPPSMWRRAAGKRPWWLTVTTYLPGDAPRAHGTSQDEKRDRRIGSTRKRYRREWEEAFDTDGVVLPSRHLRGAEVLVATVQATQDRHVIASTAGGWGELVQGDDPELPVKVLAGEDAA